MSWSALFQVKWTRLFLLWLALYLVIGFLTNSLLFTDSLYYSSLVNQVSADRISDLIHLNRKLQWITFAIMPALLLIKIALVAAVIYMGLYLFNLPHSFRDCFQIVLLAEAISVLVALVKLLYFYCYAPANLHDMQSFYPLCVTDLLNVSKLPVYVLYPLQQLNLFELGYWIAIAVGIRVLTRRSIGYAFRVVASSYGVALGVWVLCVVFIELQFTA